MKMNEKKFASLMIFFFCLLIISIPLSGQKERSIEAIEKSLSGQMPDTTRMELLIRLSQDYAKQKTPLPKARKYINDAFELARGKKWKVTYKFYFVSAQIYFAQGNYQMSLTEIEKAISLLRATNKFKELVLANSIRANSIFNTGRFSEGIELYLENYRFAGEKKLDSLLPVICRELANTYNVVGSRDQEKLWTERMLQTSLKVNDEDNLARAYFRLGDLAYQVDSNFALANEYYIESLKIREKRKDSLVFSVILSKISWNYYMMGKLDTALISYNKMASISERQSNYIYLANALANIGTIYRDKKDIGKALFYYGKSSAYAMLVKDWSTLSWMNKDMSEMFRDNGDYKKAYECYKAYKSYSDSVQTGKYNTGLAEARVRYDADTKVRDLEVLQLKLDKQRIFLIAITIGIVLFLVIILFLFRQSKLRSKRRISEMNRKISEVTQANLRQQMNPHFIFNTLNSIQYYMYQHDKISANNYLTKFSSLIRKTLENSQHTSVSIKDELDALELYLELEQIRFKDKFIYSISCDEEIDPLLYKVPTMLIQPYVENAIVHGLVNKEGQGSLLISLKLMKGFILCTVEDNGIGRKAAMEIKKNKTENHNSLGTRITESRLQLVSELYGTSMKIHYNDLTEMSGAPSGTRVEIQIPIMS